MLLNAHKINTNTTTNNKAPAKTTGSKTAKSNESESLFARWNWGVIIRLPSSEISVPSSTIVTDAMFEMALVLPLLLVARIANEYVKPEK